MGYIYPKNLKFAAYGQFVLVSVRRATSPSSNDFSSATNPGTESETIKPIEASRFFNLVIKNNIDIGK